MERNEIIRSCEKYVRDYLEGVESGHNWWHIYRVRNNALTIQRSEMCGDPFIIELASLLHDIGDSKIDRGANGTEMVRKLLTGLGVEGEIIDHVQFIMRFISFRDSFDGCPERTDELNIVQDADRLDAIGAIGIARAFSYGGSKGSEIYIPGEYPNVFGSKEEYQHSSTSTINHFYEKLLRLKDLMNTESGHKMAAERHQFMESFLEQFYREAGNMKD